MIAALAGAKVGADTGPVVGSGSAAVGEVAVESGTVAEIGTEVGSGAAVVAGTTLDPDESAGVATGEEPDTASTVAAGVEAGTASVAEDPQANIPSTTAIRGRVSSRGIPDFPQLSKWTDRCLRIICYRT